MAQQKIDLVFGQPAVGAPRHKSKATRYDGQLWDGVRLTLDDTLDLARQSLLAKAVDYDHWVMAFSGGKDSSGTLAVVIHLIETGQVPPPKTLTVLYANTRLELPPLEQSALRILDAVRAKDFAAIEVLPPMRRRFWCYVLGVGVPPPSNRFRWCTEGIKILPMESEQEQLAVRLGFGDLVWDERYGKWRYQGRGEQKLLTITGVRIGESAIRDERIFASCGRDGAECGQGWLQTTDRHDLTDTLAPLIHARVCHIWDILTFLAPGWGLPTGDIARIYGGDEKDEVNARTGCVGCDLASDDVALRTVLRTMPEWSHLAPLLRLREIKAELKKPKSRLRKDGERRQDGSLAKNQGRMGPLTFEARRCGFAQVLQIQDEISQEAQRLGRPGYTLINDEESAFIQQCWADQVWPEGWDGSEQRADELREYVVAEGVTQPLLGLALEEN